MFLILFGLWIIFNGRWTAETVLCGLAVCALVYAFAWKYIGITPKREWRLARKAGQALRYLLRLLRDIAGANLAVTKIVWRGRPEPELIAFRSRIRSEFGRAIRAGSITLTPGTVTVHVQDDLFLVHALSGALAAGAGAEAAEKSILEMEDSGDGN